MPEPVLIWWMPGEPEDDLHGFPTKKERNAYCRGDPGPFRRIVRDHHKRGPLTAEQEAVKALFAKWGRMNGAPDA